MTTAAGYEFTEHENETFRGLVTGMKRAGIAVAAGSVILLAYQLAQHFNLAISKSGESIGALYYLDVGIWCMLSLVGLLVAVLLIKATAGFHAVIHTQGDDIKHLMGGLEKLRSIVNLIFWTAVVGSSLLGISFVLLITGKT